MIPRSDAFYDAAQERIAEFIRGRVESADASGVVVALSGGVDSALTAALAEDALGAEDVVAIGLPAEGAGQMEALRDAEHLADRLGLDWRTAGVQGAVDAVLQCGEALTDPDRGARINVPPRIRMTLTYLVANAEDRLVLGTGNRSELLTGYFTKHGDGAADLLPIGDLYKTQVFDLASRLYLPEKIREKEPSAGLYPGQTDREELGFGYDELDPALHLLCDRGEDAATVAEETGLTAERVREVADMVRSSRHKRSPPPTPGLDGIGD